MATKLQIQLQHDDDGFLVGKKRIKTLENTVAATHKNSEVILSHIKTQKTGQRMVVSGRLRLDGGSQAKQTPSPAQRKPIVHSSRPHLNSTSSGAQQIGNAHTAHPLANQGERQKQKQLTRAQRRYQDAQARSNHRQELMLKEINKNLKNNRSSLLSWMGKLLPLLGMLASSLGFLSAGGGLLRNLLKSPLLIPGRNPQTPRKPPTSPNPSVPPIAPPNSNPSPAGPSSSKWEILKQGLKLIGKGGALSALFALFEGISVEQSDLERHEKNKEHAKNFAVAGGGVAGAMAGGAAGAAIGSVVPVIGTAIGGVVGAILGGLGGSTLTEYFVERVDKAIDKDLSKKMFGSWRGFIDVAKSGASHLWQSLIPSKFQTFFDKMGIDSSSLWSTVKGLADTTWKGIGIAADAVWKTIVPEKAQAFFEKLTSFGKEAFEAFKAGFNRLFEAIAKTPIGQTISDGWNAVSSYAGDAWEKTKQFVGVGDGVYGNERQKRNDADRRSGHNTQIVPNMYSMDAGVQVPSASTQTGGVVVTSQAFVPSKETQAAADFALQKAHAETKGLCALYVNDALRAQGIKVNGHGREVAKNLINSKQGFHEVKLDENYVPQKGDVMSMDAPNPAAHIKKFGVHAGHAAIFDGKQWISDYKQGNKYGNTGAAGQAYYNMLKKDPSKATIARRGSYAPSSKPQTQHVNNTKNNDTGFQFGGGVDGYITEASSKYGIDEKTLRGFVKMEGGWTGKMSKTGAIGTGQFVRGTWNELAASKDGQAIGMTSITDANFRTAQDPRHNKRINTLATGLLAKRNADILRKKGVPVTGENLYLMHNIGAGVADVLAGNQMSAKQANAVRKSMANNGLRSGESMEAFSRRQRDIFQEHYNLANSGMQKYTKPITTQVKTPPIVQPKSQQVAMNANTMALNAANIQPHEVKLPASNKGVGVAYQGGLGGQIAHAPIKRQVSHPEIANVTSGGTGA